ncbi:formimidoylglutamate deiminase [Limnohabitans sp. 2KL-17]|uniref:formimidoylglutamate deiminase n=1 Tax=Limnohabitans sp. 2KL-17 TaxID=1100704 RepID=UPI000D3526BC|nr:formimidoylglutamate deiminase [Limnohabitans sp. 2KL-17]PUE62514.1 formimidoylglutamate deiminase [Limnohabitans sp. 2KL-17]
MTHLLFAEHALLPTGWARDVLLQWTPQGQWHAIVAGQTPTADVPRAPGPVVPGMPNLHSHAFQRALAGLTEFRSNAQDSFWSWRTLMYRFAAQLSPAQLEAIATGLYVEMLEAGYTSVCEFHYLHHAANGQAFAEPAEMSLALLRAAKRTGMGLTLLPVLYQTSGFGGTAPTPGQGRFIHSTDAMMRLLERLQPLCQAQSARLGLAPHSLRAVPPEGLREVLLGLDAMDATAPVHIHIAEQRAEVDACLAWSGQRPVAWLLDHAPVNARWCLVHATHMDAQEYRRAAASGAVAGLCPTTEANLGDGIFEFNTWQDHQGAWGIGSDSHIAVHPAEDLMMLEYSQRLSLGQRNVAAHATQPEVAQALWQGAVAGGAQAAGRPVGGLAPGQQADFIVLDTSHPTLAGLSPEMMLASHVFASSRSSAVAQVWSSGQALVQQGRHALHESAMAGLVQARSQLLKG